MSPEPSTDAGPPQDIGAEHSVLSACMLDPRAIDDAAKVIVGRDFYRPANELIWAAILRLHRAGNPVEPVAVKAELESRGDLARAGGGERIFNIYSQATTASSVTYYANIVAERAMRRRLIEQHTRAIQAVHTADPETLLAIQTEALDNIRDEVEARHLNGSGAPVNDPRLLTAGEWLFDHPDEITAIWGQGDDVLWALGETLVISGPSGIGKTTIGQQLALARIGIGTPDLFGFPVQPAGRCLYLAMDRPQQARRSIRRMVDPGQREQLDDRLIVWKGPPPGQLINDTRLLLDLAHRAGLGPGDFLVVDSLKDVALDLSDGAVGAAVNSGLQELLAADIDVLALHHLRKQGGDGTAKEPESLDALYGSTWLTAGVGSVINLWGAAGDAIVSFRHLKQPADVVGPWKLKHDPESGRTEVWHDVDLLDVVRGTGRHGLTARAASTVLEPSEKEPDNNAVQRARRKLDKLVKAGLLHRQDDGPRGQATYFLAIERWDPSTGELPPDPRVKD